MKLFNKTFCAVVRWATAPGNVIGTSNVHALAECRSGGGRQRHVTIEHRAQRSW